MNTSRLARGRAGVVGRGTEEEPSELQEKVLRHSKASAVSERIHLVGHSLHRPGQMTRREAENSALPPAVLG